MMAGSRIPDLWQESQQRFLETGINTDNHLYGYSTILFVGSHFGAKTSIIERFIDNTGSGSINRPYEETIGLQYRFAKRTESNGSKFCNIWELGYELLFSDLIPLALSVTETVGLRRTSIAIVVDLTRPNDMSILLESLLAKIRSHLDTIILDPTVKENLRNIALKRSIFYRSDDHRDEPTPPDPLLIPITIIGTKYDQFQNMDPEIKKQICRYLRTVSYYEGGQLLFHSTKSDTLTKRINQSLELLAFDQCNFELEDRTKPSVSTNISKPILLPFGYDTLGKIGNVIDRDDVRMQFIRMFPQRSLEQSYLTTMGQDPRIDPNFSEIELDKILEYKYMLLKSTP